MSILLDNLKESQKLPLGHYGRKEAEKAVDKEYDLSREVSSRWYPKVRKVWGGISITPEEGARIIGKLTVILGVSKLKRIVFSSPDVHSHAVAHYCRNEIHFRGSWCNLMTLIHEFSHHVHRNDWGVRGESHGKEFAEVMDYVFEALVNYCGEKRNV